VTAIRLQDLGTGDRGLQILHVGFVERHLETRDEQVAGIFQGLRRKGIRLDDGLPLVRGADVELHVHPKAFLERRLELGFELRRRFGGAAKDDVPALQEGLDVGEPEARRSAMATILLPPTLMPRSRLT